MSIFVPDYPLVYPRIYLYFFSSFFRLVYQRPEFFGSPRPTATGHSKTHPSILADICKN